MVNYSLSPLLHIVGYTPSIVEAMMQLCAYDVCISTMHVVLQTHTAIKCKQFEVTALKQVS